MKSVCLYFHAHQPYRIKKYRVFDIGHDPEYFNDRHNEMLNNRRIAKEAAMEFYVPTLHALLLMLEKHPQMSITFSLSGVFLEQCEHYAPDVLALLKDIVRTGQAEILGETHYHSLAFFYSPTEFDRQVTKHRETVRRMFGLWPRVFRNTEFAYRNDVGVWADNAGYRGVVTEGWDPVGGWRNPNYVYKPKGATYTRLLFKNDRLSDDVLHRFSSQEWSEWPLTSDKFAHWLSESEGDTINLFFDLDTFGVRHAQDADFARFFENLPDAVQKKGTVSFKTPSEVLAAYEPREEIDMPHAVAHGCHDRELSVWSGNPMQRAALENVYALENAALSATDKSVLEDWRRLQTSDHFRHMGTSVGSPVPSNVPAMYDSPYDAYIAYMNALSDLRLRLGARH